MNTLAERKEESPSQRWAPVGTIWDPPNALLVNKRHFKVAKARSRVPFTFVPRWGRPKVGPTTTTTKTRPPPRHTPPRQPLPLKSFQICRFSLEGWIFWVWCFTNTSSYGIREKGRPAGWLAKFRGLLWLAWGLRTLKWPKHRVHVIQVRIRRYTFISEGIR